MQTVIRLKRKLEEEGHDLILVQERPAKRPNLSLLDSFSSLSTGDAKAAPQGMAPSPSPPPSFIFQRVDSISAKELATSHGSNRVMNNIKSSRRDLRQKQRSNVKSSLLQAVSVTREKMAASKAAKDKLLRYNQIQTKRHAGATASSRSMRVVEVEALGGLPEGKRVKTSSKSLVTKVQESTLLGADGVPMRREVTSGKHGVDRLLPMEKDLDKAVWTAFQKGIFDDVFRLIAFGGDVNFARVLSDHTTALMAASFHLKLGVVKELLTLGARVGKKDTSGRNSLDWAVFSLDRKRKRTPTLVCDDDEDVIEMLEEGLGREVEDVVELEVKGEDGVDEEVEVDGATESDGFMYDYFVLQPLEYEKEKEELLSRAPIVSIEQEFDDVEGITHGIEDEVWALENGVFDSDEERSDFDADDSNDEDYYGNDYPDESEHESDGEKEYFREDDDEEFENEDWNDDASA